MNRKQEKIFQEILEKNNIPSNAKFIQYRNLNEFRFFNVERINPNHIIELYGKLKNNNEKKNVCNNIHVGKIIVPFSILAITINEYFSYHLINLFILSISLMIIALSFYWIYDSLDLLRNVYDSINRRYCRCYKLRFWKNSIHDKEYS